MLLTQTSFGFPFTVSFGGRVLATGGDEAVRAMIIQVLFTAPGERVHEPRFGCGLFNLVFEPNDLVLAAAMEFTIAEALSRWLSEVIVVQSVDVEAEQENIVVQVVYLRRQDLARQAVRIQFK